MCGAANNQENTTEWAEIQYLFFIARYIYTDPLTTFSEVAVPTLIIFTYGFFKTNFNSAVVHNKQHVICNWYIPYASIAKECNDQLIKSSNYITLQCSYSLLNTPNCPVLLIKEQHTILLDSLLRCSQLTIGLVKVTWTTIFCPAISYYCVKPLKEKHLILSGDDQRQISKKKPVFRIAKQLQTLTWKPFDLTQLCWRRRGLPLEKAAMQTRSGMLSSLLFRSTRFKKNWRWGTSQSFVQVNGNEQQKISRLAQG